MRDDKGNPNERVLKRILTEGLQKVREWFSKKDAPYLRSIFDQIGFMDRDGVTDVYYVPPRSLGFNITYPVKGNDPVLDEVKAGTFYEITTRYRGLHDDYLGKLSLNQLLFLLEKFGGTVPFEGDKNISIFDTYKIKAAKAIIALNRDEYKHCPGSLIINVDLSGIQRFIYNIASRGALKNLRSRSFFIELLCNHTINRVITNFNLHPVNVLMNGGGNLSILSSKPLNYKELIDDIAYNLNLWLFEEFNGTLQVVFTSIETSDDDMIEDISELLKKISAESFRNKNKKFDSLIQKGKFIFVGEEDPGSQSCEICHKDFFAQKGQKQVDSEDISKCAFCDRLVRLGSVIPKVKYVYMSDKDGPRCLQIEDSYYFLSEEKQDLPCTRVVFDDKDNFLDELGTLEVPFFARTYVAKAAMLPEEVQDEIAKEKAELELRFQKAEEPAEKQWLRYEIDSLSDEHPAMLEHLADASAGAKLIGALRMDADNMGKILQKGFRDKATLEKISAFSRSLNYFFKLYLESICSTDALRQKEKKRLVHVIYAGGDDLFALGTWNDIAELSLGIGDAFREYTCGNIDLGLSGGFTVHKPKFPVSNMASLCLIALNHSKENWEPCWFCRKEWIRCPLFRDGNCLRKDSLTPFFTEYKAALKYKLDKEFIRKYLSEPSRLKLSFKRKRFVIESRTVADDVADYIVRPLKVFTADNRPQPSRGFMHNVLSMLEVWYSDGLLYLPGIAWLLEKQKQKLQSIIEKETGSSMYDVYDQHLHLASPRMLSALHIPLSWAILLMKEGERTNESGTDGRETFEPVGSKYGKRDQG